MMAAAAAGVAAAGGAPTGAGELEGLVQDTFSFLGGLWSSGTGARSFGGDKQDGDKIGESLGRAFEDFDMLVSGVGVIVGGGDGCGGATIVVPSQRRWILLMTIDRSN
jgi:hypothetical protein